MTPWETVCIDLIGPYTVTDRLCNGRILNSITFVEPATGWFEVTEIPDKISHQQSLRIHGTGKNFCAYHQMQRKILIKRELLVYKK